MMWWQRVISLTVLILIVPVAAFSQGFLQEQLLAPPGLETYDNFGYSVSVFDDYLEDAVVAVGAHADDHDGIKDVGTVRIYVHNQNTWEHVAMVLPDDKSENLLFGRSVSLHDRYLLVGANGFAYVFYRENDGSWTQQAKWSNGNLDFGEEVLIDGRWAMVSLATSTYGASRVFAYYRDDAGTWTLRNTLVPDEDSMKYFGRSIAIGGRYMIVSDGYYQTSNNLSYYKGRAYVYYVNDDNTWTEKAQIKGTHDNSRYGLFVGLEGQYAFVGDPGNTFVYERTKPDWSDTEIWTGIQQISEAKGQLVAEGKYLLVGLAYQENLLRFYARNSEGQFNLVSERNKKSDFDIGFHGNYAITGDPTRNAVGATNSGAAYVYKMLYADIAIQPSLVSFGPLDMTDVSDTTISIQSTGVSDATIDSVYLVQGVNAFSFTGPSQNVIPANSSENMVIHFSPPDTGAFVDTLIVNHNGDSSPAKIALSGTGTLPKLNVSSDKVDFGVVNIHEPYHLEHGPGIRHLTILNSGTGILRLNHTEIVGQDSVAFAITNYSLSGQWSAYTGQSLSISNQDTLKFLVRFDPDSVGSQSAVLKLHHGKPDSIAQISLTGSGRLPFVLVSQSELEFGDVPVLTSKRDGFWIYNNSENPLNITEITVTDSSFSLEKQPVFEDNKGEVAAKDSMYITVLFEPLSEGTKSGELLLKHNGEGQKHSVSLTGKGLAVPALALGSGTGTLGFLATVPLELFNSVSAPIAALQFRLVVDDTNIVKFETITSELDSNSFTISNATNEDTTKIVIVPRLDPLVPELPTLKTQKIGNLYFRVSPSANSDAIVPIRIVSSFASDTLFTAIPLVSLDGNVEVEAIIRGDVTADGVINVADVINLILIILGDIPQPLPETSAFVRSDANFDGAINVLDAVIQLRTILGLPSKTLAAVPSDPVIIGLGDPSQSANNKFLVPIQIASNGQLAALEFTLGVNADGISIGQVLLSERATGMSAQSRVVDGHLRIVIYSLEGRGISAGSGPVAYIPITVTEGKTSSDVLSISSVTAANYLAESVPVTLKDTGESLVTLPRGYRLLEAAPNPFNPSTTIAYEVPEQTHITLTVYNLLGQEVVRLVDQVQAAGRYEAAWNGANITGAGVSSGIYLYRITSSSGFSETKRMTLLK